jgi:hypothetical protein
MKYGTFLHHFCSRFQSILVTGLSGLLLFGCNSELQKLVGGGGLASAVGTIQAPASTSVATGTATSASIAVSPAPSKDLVLNWQLVGPSGYFAETSGTITVPAGSTSVNINLTSLAPSVYSGKQSFTLQLSASASSSSGQTYNVSSGIVVLQDTTPMPTLSISSPTANASDASVAFVVTQSALSTLDSKFTVSLADGTASVGTDYQALSAVTYTIPAGRLSTNISVLLTDPHAGGPARTFTATLSQPTNVALGATVAGTATLNEDSSGPTLSFTAPSSGSSINLANQASFAFSGACSVDNAAVQITGVLAGSRHRRRVRAPGRFQPPPTFPV